MRKMPGLSKLMADNRFVLVLSVSLAVVCWIVVAMTSQDTIERTIRGVPVNLNIKANELADVGLIFASTAEHRVNVTVSGRYRVVRGLKADDMIITVQVAGITEPNTYDLTLKSAVEADEYKIDTIINPATKKSSVRIRLDQVDTDDFTVDEELRGLAVPPGYHLEFEQISVRPRKITVSGPVSELERIEHVRAEVELSEDPLTQIYSDSAVPVKLYDIAGQPIDPVSSNLSLSHETVNVTIPILKIKEVALEVAYTNAPDLFPFEELEKYMTAPQPRITIAGPANIIENRESLRLGTIDMRTLTPENNSFSFNVALPSDQFVNIDKIFSGVVEFDSSDWTSATFNVSNIKLTHMPPEYKVTLVQSSMRVTFVGKKEDIERMTSSDIEAEARLSERELTLGQYSYPIHFSVPTLRGNDPDKNAMVWPAGDEYTIVIRVEE